MKNIISNINTNNNLNNNWNLSTPVKVAQSAL